MKHEPAELLAEGGRGSGIPLDRDGVRLCRPSAAREREQVVHWHAGATLRLGDDGANLGVGVALALPDDFMYLLVALKQEQTHAAPGDGIVGAKELHDTVQTTLDRDAVHRRVPESLQRRSDVPSADPAP